MVSGLGVSGGCLVGIYPGWGNEFGEPVGGDADIPAAVMNGGVVIGAQQDQVVQGGGAAVGPVDDVMECPPPSGLRIY